MDILAQLFTKGVFALLTVCFPHYTLFTLVSYKWAWWGTKPFNIQTTEPHPMPIPGSPGVAATVSPIHLSWDLRQVFQSLHLTTHSATPLSHLNCFRSLLPGDLAVSSPGIVKIRWDEPLRCFTVVLAQKLSVKFCWRLLSLPFMMITAHTTVGLFYWELTDLFPLDVVLC